MFGTIRSWNVLLRSHRSRGKSACRLGRPFSEIDGAVCNALLPEGFFGLGMQTFSRPPNGNLPPSSVRSGLEADLAQRLDVRLWPKQTCDKDHEQTSEIRAYVRL